MNYFVTNISSGEHVSDRIANELPTSACQSKEWVGLWSECVRAQLTKSYGSFSTPFVIYFAVESFSPAGSDFDKTAQDLLCDVEKFLGNSPSDLAKILRVTRPMIYHYRDGMEPSSENKVRLRQIADLANEWRVALNCPLGKRLKTPQSDGSTLFGYLSADHLDFSAVRNLLGRIANSDLDVRRKLADALRNNESLEQRKDVLRERQDSGKFSYVGDPDKPGWLIQIDPEGRKIRGRMIKR